MQAVQGLFTFLLSAVGLDVTPAIVSAVSRIELTPLKLITAFVHVVVHDRSLTKLSSRQSPTLCSSCSRYGLVLQICLWLSKM